MACRKRLSCLLAAALVWVGTLLPGAVGAADLTVAAAASLREALVQVAALFQEARPTVRVRLSFAASGAVLRQLQQGAPLDVVAFADMETMRRAETSGGVVAATSMIFAENRLVLIRPAGARGPVGLADLARRRVLRVAVGNPGFVPAGRYARAALQQAGLWTELEGKLLLANSVRHVLDYVGRGEAEAGLVYATDVPLARDAVIQVAELPLPFRLTYPAAVATGSGDRRLAEQFLGFLVGPQARGVFSAFGFLPHGPSS